MPNHQRPHGRQTFISGQGSGLHRRGSSGAGQVGGGMSGRPSGSSQGGGSFGSSGVTRAGNGKLSIIAIIIAAVVLLGGGGGILGSLFGGSSNNTSPVTNLLSGLGDLGGLANLLGGATSFSGSQISTGWDRSDNTGRLNTSVAPEAREKYTEMIGNGQDTVTIMVYLCGTDLESKNGMATADLKEMAKATIGKNINLLIYTGGCKQWKTQGISSDVNQIYQISNGKLSRLVDNDGNKKMTSPDTLASFITFCNTRFPANRRMLIFWDHGGGSVSGYGYDEKNASSGSMSLSGIQTALKKANLKFDVIGFDACLMATAENALMLSDYADYMIASEETEPGIGWFYTNWLSALSSDPSMSTVKLGQKICDDFVDTCAKQCPGQKATLSVVDLAELSATVPEELNEFASSTLTLLQSDQYESVSTARSGSREFAASNKIDQVDLVHLADRINTKESKALSTVLLNAVKYNRTSFDMTNAYGLSIYFPYQKTSTVDSAVKTYQAIGMDGDYAACIRRFASLEVGGQVAAGGTSSPFGSILSGLTSSIPSGGADMISSLLSSFLGGNKSIIAGLDKDNTEFLSELDDDAASYIAAHSFDASKLVWTKAGKGYTMKLPESMWKLVQDLELNVFYDDGEGYLDLGFDNVFSFTDDGDLIGSYDGSWLAINGQIVAYYYESAIDEGKNYTITGHVPVLLNGTRADLILVFDNDHPRGMLAGARYVYAENETDTVAKGTSALEIGDKIDFLCDYYDYNGKYLDNYMIGDQMIYDGRFEISNAYLPDDGKAIASYRFTDLYHNIFWTEKIPR